MQIPFRAAFLCAVILLCLGTRTSARSQDLKNQSPTSTVVVSGFAESESGLKSYLESVLEIVKSGDKAKLSVQMENVMIPNHEEWFVKIFGPEEGRRLGTRYADLLPGLTGNFGQRLKRALDAQRTNITISMFQKPIDPSAMLAHAIGEAMIQPISFYSANAMSADQQSSTYLGYFVYVDGAFHFVDPEVYQALSTMPPLRIRQGENVTAASIIRQDPPIYPNEARKQHIQGDVVLHVIIDIHGAVENIEVVSGDPLLTDAAVEAVKHWMYKPTLLNGKPVVVDTKITVSFRFSQ